MIFARMAGGFSALSGLVVLLGWATQNHTLISLSPAVANMKANSAICFVLLGTSLIASTVGATSLRRTTAFLAFLLSAVTVAEILSRRELGVDEFFVLDYQKARFYFPGRMAPATALNLMLLGLALFWFGEKRWQLLLDVFMFFSLLNSGFCLLCYTFGASSLYESVVFSSVALHTALCLFLLSLGLLAAHPDRKVVNAFLSDSSSGVMLRQLFPVALVAPVIIGDLLLRTHRAGYFDTETSACLMALACTLIFCSLIVVNSSRLNAADQKLRNQEANKSRLAAIVESSDDAILAKSLDGKVLTWNGGAEKIFGFKAEEIIGRPISLIISPELRNELQQVSDRVKNGEHITNYETRRIRKDGKTIDVSLSVSPVFNADGEICALSSIARDITARKLKEQLFFASVESAPIAMLMINRQGKMVLANEEAERLFRRTREELLGQPVEILVPERFRWHHPQLRTSFFQHPEPRRMGAGRDLYGLRKDGTEFPVEIGLNPVRTGDEEYVLSVIADLTERRRAEQHAKMQSAKLQEQAHIIDLAHILVRDTEGKIVFWSQGAEKLYGWTKDEVLGRDSHEVLKTVFPISRDEIELELKQKGSWEGELKHFNKRGKQLTVASHWVVHQNADNSESAILELNNDVTPLKDLEEQLLQSQKMEAIGRLAGGIAHDFNNLLTAILGYSQIAKSQTSPDDPLHTELSIIENAGRRAASLTAQLLAFSRKQVLLPKLLDLNSIVSEIGLMLQRLISENIELKVETEPDLNRIKADPSQMNQVLMNLALNARDAMPKGGKLTIETKNIYLSEGYAREHNEVLPGPYVMIAITDTGRGMDRVTQERVFEPFFTTKPRGEGTGLGLSTVYGIVKQSGGHIWVYSELGRGTTFKIYFPQAELDSEQTGDENIAPETMHGTESVLIVEDEESLRKLAAKVLRLNGYQVFEASNAEAALELIAGSKSPIDLVLTDVIMPGMGGILLSEKLREQLPSAKVVFMSGYTDSAIVHQGVLDPGIPFLQKPFSPDYLALTIRRVLDGKSLTTGAIV